MKEIRCRTLQLATLQGQREDLHSPFQPVRLTVILDEGLSTERAMSFNVGDEVVFTFWHKDPGYGSS
jgi:hypothetical protein